MDHFMSSCALLFYRRYIMFMQGSPTKINPNSDQTIKEWEFHVMAWKRSGMTQKKYCQHANINYWTFKDWRKKIKKEKSPAKSTSVNLVQLDISTCNPKASSVNHPSTQSSIRFWVNDFCVEVDNHFSSETLSQLIEVLRSQRCG